MVKIKQMWVWNCQKRRGEISLIYGHLERCLDFGTSIREEIELKFGLEVRCNIIASKYCQKYSFFLAKR